MTQGDLKQSVAREAIKYIVDDEVVGVGSGSTADFFIDELGKVPLHVEVIPMARAYVARQMVRLGGQPKLREGFTTDNGNLVLDVWGLSILNPVELETAINNVTGVVTSGLFARRGADVLLLGNQSGVKTMTRK